MRAERNIIILLCLVVALNLTKIWYFKYFPSADGASHLEIAKTVYSLYQGNCPNINDLYKFTNAVTPNWLVTLLLIPLLQFFEPHIAEKLVISLYIISFPAACYNFIKSINPKAIYWALPCCIFLPNYLLYSGSYNFLLSFVLYIISLKWFITNRQNLNKENIIILFTLFSLNYLFHLFGLLGLCFSIFVIYSHDLLTKQINFKSYVRSGFICLFAALPSIAALLQYLSLPKILMDGVIPFSRRAASTIFPDTLFTLAEGEKFIMISASFGMACLLSYFIYTKPKVGATSNKFRSLGFISLGFIIIMLVSPASFAGGWLIEPRLQMYFFILALFWFSNFNFSKKLSIIISTASVLIISFQAFINIPVYEKYNKSAKNIDEQIKQIPNGATVYAQSLSPFTIDYTTGEQLMRFTFSHMAGYVVTAKTCVAEISNYHLAERNAFPVSYKDSRNPHYTLGKFRTSYALGIIPGKINLDNYFKLTATKPDYVIVMGSHKYLFHYTPESGYNENELYQNFERELKNHFKLNYTSDDQLLKIYKSNSQ